MSNLFYTNLLATNYVVTNVYITNYDNSLIYTYDASNPTNIIITATNLSIAGTYIFNVCICRQRHLHKLMATLSYSLKPADELLQGDQRVPHLGHRFGIFIVHAGRTSLPPTSLCPNPPRNVSMPVSFIPPMPPMSEFHTTTYTTNAFCYLVTTNLVVPWPAPALTTSRLPERCISMIFRCTRSST